MTTTDDLPIRDPDQIRQDCARKLRAVQVSTHFQAILGCLLGEDWTTPRLVEMVITPDGHMLGRPEGEPSFKAFLGAAEDLIKNIHGIGPVAELDGDEIGYLVSKVAEIKKSAVTEEYHVDIHQTRLLQCCLRSQRKWKARPAR